MEEYKIVKVNIQKQKEAAKRYYQANREKIFEQRKRRYKERYNSDEEFRDKQKAEALKRYYVKKNLLKDLILNDEIKE